MKNCNKWEAAKISALSSGIFPKDLESSEIKNEINEIKKLE